MLPPREESSLLSSGSKGNVANVISGHRDTIVNPFMTSAVQCQTRCTVICNCDLQVRFGTLLLRATIQAAKVV